MKRIAALLIMLALLFSLSSALAQRVSCSVGGFSLTLPNHFTEESPDPADPELCFFWHGSKLTVQAYASPLGEVAGSDLFQVLTGSETESGTVSVNGMNMLYTRAEDSSEISICYSWMDRGNNVTLYFFYSASDPSVQKTVDSIISSIAFDAGH